MDRHFLSSEASIDYTLPLIVIISLSSIIFRRIVVPFYNIDEPREIENPVLDADSTPAILHNLGLEFLTHKGSFYTLIMFYLINLNNLTHKV